MNHQQLNITSSRGIDASFLKGDVGTTSYNPVMRRIDTRLDGGRKYRSGFMLLHGSESDLLAASVFQLWAAFLSLPDLSLGYWPPSDLGQALAYYYYSLILSIFFCFIIIFLHFCKCCPK